MRKRHAVVKNDVPAT